MISCSMDGPSRLLSLIDQFRRQSPLTKPRSGFGGRDVVAALELRFTVGAVS